MVCFATLLCFAPVDAKASEKEEVLRSCRQLFGKSADEKLNLFEVNRFYVLRVIFDGRDNLRELAVEPKHYFEETYPDWKKYDDLTYLSKVEYKNLLAKLDAIKPKGVLVRPASPISIVTNMTAWQTEIYKKAALITGTITDVRRDKSAPLEIKWLRLSYGNQKSR